MEKVLQILLVFALLMLVIWRSIRGKEERFRRLSYLTRLRPPLSEEILARLITGSFGAGGERADYGVPEEADAFLVWEDSRILLCYRLEGKMTVYRLRPDGKSRELQELSVPMDCTAIALDPLERTLYLEEGGYLYVYGPED